MSDTEKIAVSLIYAISCVICLASLTQLFKEDRRPGKDLSQVLWAVTPFLNTLMALGLVFFTLLCLSMPCNDEETS